MTAFVDPNVQIGQTYTYTVKTWNITGLSAPATLTVPVTSMPPPPGQDWPTYLYDNTRSASSPEGILNAGNAPTLGLKWSLTTGNSVVASAAVVNGVAYVGSWDGFEYALNASSGAIIWKTSLGITTNPNCSYPVTAGVTSGATVVGGVVYVGGGDSFWYALDANTGAILWKVFTGDNSVAGAHYNWSSPLIYNGFAYIGIASNCDNPLVQGQLLQVNLTTHAVTNTAVFVPNGGQVGGGVWTSPAVDAATNTVFLDTGTVNQYTQTLAQAVVALDATTLAIKSSWALPFQDQTFDSDWGVTPTLVTDTAGDQLLSLANKNGVLYTFNRNNLAAGPIWQQRIAVGGECPTCGDGTISSGAFVNNFTIGAYTGPVLFYAAGNNMYNSPGNSVGYQGGVWAFNPGTGAVLWFHPTNGMILGGLAYDNGLLVEGQGNTVEVLNAANGQALYDYTTTGPIYAGASISRGQIYMGGADGNVYAFGLPATASNPPADANCPATFVCQDIGGATAGSEVVNSDGSWTVTASGAKIHDTSDQFRFISQNITGDNQLISQLTQQSTQNTQPQAGIMVRQSADPRAPFYAMLAYPNNNPENQPAPKINVWFRALWGQTSVELTKLYPAFLPKYMMIQRVGDIFTASISQDGVNFSTLSGTTHSVVMPTTAMEGVAVDSGANATFGTATFTPVTSAAVSIHPTNFATATPCPQGWTCQGINTPNPPGDQSLTNGTFTLSGAGAGITSGVFTAYGHEDSFHYVYKTVPNDQTITAQFAGFGANAPAGAEAGLMMRASTDPHAPYYGIFVYPTGKAIVQWRTNPNMVGRFAYVKLPAPLPNPLFLQVVRYTDTRFNPAPTYYSAAMSSDGVNWRPVDGTTAAIDMGGGSAGPTLVGMAASANAINVTAPASFTNVAINPTSVAPPGICPTDFSCADVGTSNRGGNQTYLGHVWTMVSAGDMWDVYDQFRYIWQPMSGDGTASIRVAAMQNAAGPWAKAGVMIRSGATDPQAPYYGAFLTPQHGIAVQWRPTQAAQTQQIQLGTFTTPTYLMVSRYTDVAHNNTVYYTTYYSTDNVTWSAVPGSTIALNLPGALSAGMAASSYSTAQTMTTTFDSWSLLGSAPPPPWLCPAQWTCEDMNGALPGGSQSLTSGTWTIAAGGQDIWDVADQFHLISQALPADGTVSAHIAGVANAGMWAKGGVMLRNAAGDPDPAAPNYGIFMTPSNGVVVQWRPTEGATTSQIQIPGAPGLYLMVDRWTDPSSHVTYYQALTSTTGAAGSWTAVPGSLQVIPGLTGSLLAGMATDSWNQGTAATWTIDTVAVTNTGIAPQGACPTGWACQDIGGATPAGGQSLSTGAWTVQAGGNDIWTTSDSFRLISQSLAADGSVSARVVTQSASDPWAKSGVMLRSTNDPGSPYYAILTTPSNGIVVQWRATQAATTNSLAIAGAAPVYVKVSRWTDTSGGSPITYLSAYTSPDGTTWTAVPGSTQRINLTGTLLAGLAATSHNGGVLATDQFDNVSINTAAQIPAGVCLATWTCTDVGGAFPVGNQTPANSTGAGWTVNGGGGDIWDVADSFHFVSQALPGDGTVSARLVSQTATDPWAKAGIMVRGVSGSPAAGDPYYAVLVTANNGIVIQYRTASGVTTNAIAARPAPTTLPVTLSITRTGTTFSVSLNGTVVAGSSVTIAALTGSLQAGLVVCSHNTSALISVVFDTVTM
jgi:outer membrane protein assembly factor BamB